MNELEELLDEMWVSLTGACNCGLDDPEPKWHDYNCTYRVIWENNMQTVHMNSGQLEVAERVTGWKSSRYKHRYFPDFLDDLFRQRVEERNYCNVMRWR